MLTKEQLIEAASRMIGGDLSTLTIKQIGELMTVTQFVTDACLNEIEARGELTYVDGLPLLPYLSNFAVETVLTRGPDAPCQYLSRPAQTH